MADMRDDMDSGDEIRDEFEVQDGETQAESWQEDLPPDDDFHDNLTDASEAGDEDTATAASPDGKKGKNKSTVIFMGAVAALVLVAGGVAFTQLGGEASNGALPPQLAEAAKSATKAKIEQAKKQEEKPATPTSAEVDMKSFYDAIYSTNNPEKGAAVALPGKAGEVTSPNKPETAPKFSEVITDANKTAVSAANARIQPTLGVSKENMQAAQPVVEDKIKIEEVRESPETKQLSGDAGNTEARISEISSKIEGLEKSLEQTSKQIAQLVFKMEELQASAGRVSPSTVYDDKIKSMEKQIAFLSSMPRQANSSQTSQGVEIKENQPPEAIAEIEVAPKKEVSKPKPKPAKKKSVASKTSKKKSKPAKEEENVSWVLRAATPEAAWVAKDSMSSDLRKVEVGDTLPGIGRINSIRQIGDNWSVVGSSGTVR